MYNFKKLSALAAILLILTFGMVEARGGTSSSSSSSSSRSSSSSSSFSKSSSSSSSWGNKSSSSSPSSWGNKSSSSSPSSWGNKSSSSSPTKSYASESPKTSSWGNKSATASQPTTPSNPTWGNKSVTGTTTPTSARANIMNNEAKGKVQADYVAKKEAAESARRQAEYAKMQSNWNNSRTTFSTGKTAYTPKYVVVNRQPAQHTIVVNRYHNNYGGYYYNDPYNHRMIWMFSDLWWYNHWHQIDRERYANDSRYREIEARMRAMEAKGTPRDPNYRDPGMDDGVMYGDGYLNAKAQPVATTTTAPVSSGHGLLYYFMWVLGLAALGVCAVVAWKVIKIRKGQA